MLVSVNVLTLISLVAVGLVYGYVRYRLDQIKTINGLPLARGASGGGGSSGGLSPMNILLVGDNSRVGLSPSEAAKFGTTDQAGGSHSDVTMVLHLDPARGTASLLSIPRDLFVPLPPTNISGPVGKIDSALNGSNYQYSDGAAQLITTIQDDFGIPINHYVQINFDGFQRTIDALGGLDMYFPTPLYDIDAALRITKPGCLHLSGSTALAVVRSRHLQYFQAGDDPYNPSSWTQEMASDLARIQRDHTFLRILAATVTSQGITADLGKLNNVVGAVINQVTVDPGLKGELIPLVKRFRRINLDAVAQLTLPVSVVPDIQYRYQGGVYGQVDRYHPGSAGLAQAETVVQSLVGAVMMQSDPTVPAGSVVVDTGTSLSVAPPPATSLTVPVTATSSTVATPGNQPISSATDQPAAWDPVACTAGQPVVPS